MCLTALTIPKWCICRTWGFLCPLYLLSLIHVGSTRRVAMGKTSMEATPTECKEAETWPVNTSEPKVLLCKVIAPSGDTAPSFPHAFNMHLYLKKKKGVHSGEGRVTAFCFTNLSEPKPCWHSLYSTNAVTPCQGSREKLCCSAE